MKAQGGAGHGTEGSVRQDAETDLSPMKYSRFFLSRNMGKRKF